MKSLFKLKTSTLAMCVLIHLLIVIFMPIWRSMILDTAYLRDIPLFILTIFWILFLINDAMHGRSVHADLLTILVGLYLVYGVFMIIYAIDTAGLDLFVATVQFRNYFLPVILFFIARRAFVSSSSLKSLLFFFLIIFLLNGFYIILEYGGHFAGINFHKLPWHEWRSLTDIRFEHSGLSETAYNVQADQIYTFAYGIQGFPHYTAPGMVAIFCMIFPFTMQKKEYYPESWPLGNRPRLAFFGILAIMILSITFLSVKTHMVTTLLAVFALTILIRRRYFFYFAIVLLIVVVILLNSPLIVDRLNVLWDQVTVGDVQEGSRIEIIFNLEGLMYYLSNSLNVILFGTGDLRSQSLSRYIFEIKFFVYLLTFGVVWFLLFCGINFVSVIYAVTIFRNKFFLLQAHLFAAGIIGMCSVYLLEMLHFGQSISMPNIEIWSVSLGAFSAMRQRLKYQTHPIKKNKIVPGSLAHQGT